MYPAQRYTPSPCPKKEQGSIVTSSDLPTDSTSVCVRGGGGCFRFGQSPPPPSLRGLTRCTSHIFTFPGGVCVCVSVCVCARGGEGGVKREGGGGGFGVKHGKVGREKKKKRTKNRKWRSEGWRECEEGVSAEHRGHGYGNGWQAASSANCKQDLGKAYSPWPGPRCLAPSEQRGIKAGEAGTPLLPLPLCLTHSPSTSLSLSLSLSLYSAPE